MAVEDLPLLERAAVIRVEVSMPAVARQVIVDLATEVQRLRELVRVHFDLYCEAQEEKRRAVCEADLLRVDLAATHGREGK